MNISFRKLEEKDFSLLHKWFNTDHVAQWYGDRESFEEVCDKYLDRVRGIEAIHSFIITVDSRDIGYIQTYLLNDFPDYSSLVNVEEIAAGMDLFIGDENYIHKGIGKSIMSKFLREHVFALKDVTSCIIGPEPANKSAIRAYEKTGFSYLKTIKTDDGEEYLMKLGKGRVIGQ